MMQVNNVPVSQPGSLKVTNIPSFVTQDDFGRLFLSLEGCISAQLAGRQPTGDQFGFVEFTDKMSASKAKNLYQGWGGWGGRGLNLDFNLSAQPQQGPGQKRTRDGEDAYQQAGGNYKQQRAEAAPMGLGGQLGGGGPLPQDTLAQLQASGMLSGLMQPGVASQYLGQQAGAQMGGLQSAGIASNIAGQTTPTGQQQSQQFSQQAQQQGLSGLPQHAQQGGMGMGQLGGGQAAGQLGMGAPGGQQQGAQQAQQAMGGAGQQPPVQDYQGAYFTSDGMLVLNTSAAGGQQVGGQQVGQAGTPQQSSNTYQPQPLSSLQGQLPAGFSLQPGTLLLQPSSGGYQQLQPGQVIQMPQQQLPSQQAQQAPPQQAQQLPQQYLQPGQPTILQPGQIQISGVVTSQPGGGVMLQPGQPQGQHPSLAPITLQQPPAGAPILQQQPLQVQQYTPDACPTLYAEGFPEDMTKRELMHIFRPFEGFKNVRFVVKDSKKHAGEKMVMAFVEFSNTYFATECMNALKGYALDLDDPDSHVMRIKYARPLENPGRVAPQGGGYGGGRGGFGGGGGRGDGGRGPSYGGRGGYMGGRGRGGHPRDRDDRRDDRRDGRR